MAKGFDTDRAFMIVEIAGEELHFQTISRAREEVDSGELVWQKQPPPPKTEGRVEPSLRVPSLQHRNSPLDSINATHP
jgi:hypothetical protein